MKGVLTVGKFPDGKEREVPLKHDMSTLIECPHCHGDGEIQHASNAAGIDSSPCWLCSDLRQAMMFVDFFGKHGDVFGKTTLARYNVYMKDSFRAYSLVEIGLL